MYNNLAAPCDGEIKEIDFEVGESVKKGDVLCYIKPEKK